MNAPISVVFFSLSFLPPSFFPRFYHSQFLAILSTGSSPFTYGYISPLLYCLIPWDFSLLSLKFHQPFLASCEHPFRITHQLVGYPATISIQSVLAAPLFILGQNSFVLFLPLILFALPEWIRIRDSLSLYLYGMHQVVQALCLPLLGEMPSQQGIFPKRSLSRNPKIDPFSLHHQTTPSESLDRGPTSPILVGYMQVVLRPLYVSSTTLCICRLLFPISAILSMSHSATCLLCSCLSSTARRAWVPRLVLSFLISSWVWTSSWQKPLPVQPVGLLLLLPLFLLYLWACQLSLLLCWPIGFTTSLLRLPWPIYFTFTSYYVHGPAGCHSYHVGLLGLSFLSLGFHDLFTLLLPLIVPMGLLTIIPAMLARCVYHFFLWASTAYLLYFYLLLCLWAY